MVSHRRWPRRAADADDIEGGHGFAPMRPELHASLIMRGSDVTRRGSLGVVRMTQVGPTLATWLGVSLSPKADTPLAVASDSTPAPAKKSRRDGWARPLE